MLTKQLASLLGGLSAASAALTYKGVDWSSVQVEEDAGISYKTSSGTAEPLETILAAAGVNTVRQRIWVNPSDGNYDLDYNLALAKRANAAGLGVYLDLHFSDTWADPTNQAIPSGWPTAVSDLACKLSTKPLPVEACRKLIGVSNVVLAGTLYNYTMEVSNAFASAGITPKIISIGNEISDGLLFPTGNYDTNGFGNIATLLHSAAWGIKDSDLSAQPLIMVHLSNGWDWSLQEWFYEGLLGTGTFTTDDFDVMGVSYYPFYDADATLASLKSSLTNMASKWGKDIMIAETNWPVSCPSPAYSFPSDTTSIPISAEGQSTWLKQLTTILDAVSNANGLFYWEPAWVDNAGLGSSCSDNCMFEYAGTARSSLSTFASLS